MIGEVDKVDAKKVKRVLLCCGKIYYELLAHRRANNIKDMAIIRLEQMYPFPAEEFAAEMEKYPNAKEIVWVQEEPRNQGMWYWLSSRQHLDNVIGTKRRLLLVSRPGGLAGSRLLRDAQFAAEGGYRKRLWRNQGLKQSNNQSPMHKREKKC